MEFLFIIYFVGSNYVIFFHVSLVHVISDNELTGLARRSSAYLAIALLLIFFFNYYAFFSYRKKKRIWRSNFWG